MTEIYTSRLPQELLMTLLTYQATFPNRHFQADQNPLHQAKWRAAMYCTISTRTTETDQRRFAKKAHTKFPTHGLVEKFITTAFCKAFGSGNFCPGFSFFSFFFVIGFFFLKGGFGEGRPPSYPLLCMCATVVYPPKPTQGSCMYEGQPG